MKKLLIILLGFLIVILLIMNNVPTWQQILGTTQVSQLNIQSPYDSSMDVANQFPAGAFAGSQINGLSEISVGQTDDQSATMSGSDPAYRFWVGAQAAVNAPFTISKTGQVVIKNSQSSTILDATGLVSGTNFANNTYSANNYISTDSGTSIDVSGSSLTFILQRTTNVYISITAAISYTSGSVPSGGYVYLVIDGVTQHPAMLSLAAPSSGSIIMSTVVSFSGIYSLAVGSHTIKMQWCSYEGPGYTISMTDRNLNYVVLGS
jgi:hypothetical protein